MKQLKWTDAENILRLDIIHLANAKSTGEEKIFSAALQSPPFIFLASSFSPSVAAVLNVDDKMNEINFSLTDK